MANVQENNKDSVQWVNRVDIDGYLKDNTLKRIVTSTHKNAIAGQLVIATEENAEFRVKFMASSTYNNGNDNPQYKALESLLPENTVTVKSLLEANPQATFEQVMLQATKITAIGSFEVYDRKDEKNEIHTSVIINGRKAFIRSAVTQSSKPWVAGARYKVEGYINGMKNEMKDEEETGRLFVDLLLPDSYRETVTPIQLVAEGKIAEIISGNWERGNTVTVSGTLVNSRVVTQNTGKARVSLLGNKEELPPTITFVNERLIVEPFPPFEEDDAKYVQKETMVSYCVNRQKMLDELTITADKPKTAAATDDSDTSNFAL